MRRIRVVFKLNTRLCFKYFIKDNKNDKLVIDLLYTLPCNNNIKHKL